ncbi:hypothetical protein [Telmatospirillum sp.]|uniref:hypothetical protein n=1 Tax=Telmatospirillum sp. TaxID=2079197 RepID=UPI0028456EC8|nr:hypothetical protein [Telmatospirillum sp.]MDR3437443.1 hypothetical protein [Telmatospirillum sp.]
MASQKASSVHIGDRFVKTGDQYGRIWTIIRLWTTVDGIPHARMENNGQQRESRIISISALLDAQFYAPAPSVAGFVADQG